MVVHADKHASELLLDDLELSQRQRRIPKLPLIDPLPHDVINHISDLRGSWIMQHMSRRLYPVSQHTDSRLSRLWNRPWIREVRGIGRAIPFPRLLQEIRDRRGPVMLGNKRSHASRKVILSRQLEPFANVIPDDRGTRRGL